MRSSIEIKRIDLWSLFKVAFLVYAALGLIGGLFYAFFLFLATGLGGAFLEEELPHFGLLGGVLGIILVPVIAVFYGAIGSVFATIVGGIFNLAVKISGGPKFDIDMWQPGGFVQTGVVGTGVPPQAPPPTGQPTPPTSPPPQSGGPTTPGPTEPQT